MDKTFKINEAIKYMKDNFVITTNNNDYYSLVNDKVHYKFNGSSVSLSLDDFTKLFCDAEFSLTENNSFLIDELKDKEYYEKYRK